MTPLQYLMTELKFKSSDWQPLNDHDKQWLKDAAAKEMAVLGVPISEAPTK